MKNRLFRSCQLGFIAVSLVFLGICAGCQSVPERVSEQLEVTDADVKDILVASMSSVGGVDAWAKTAVLNATALTTLPQADGSRILLEQHYMLSGGINPSLNVTSIEPAGPFTETLYADGRLIIDHEVDVENLDIALIRGSMIKLRLIMQSLTGPVGLLLRDDLELNYLGSQREAGRMVHKIEAAGLFTTTQAESAVTDRLVIWIDAQTKRIGRMWLCPPGQSGCLAISVRDYEQLSSGFSVPSVLELAMSSRAQDFSEEPMMIVEFQQFDVTLSE